MFSSDTRSLVGSFYVTIFVAGCGAAPSKTAAIARHETQVGSSTNPALSAPLATVASQCDLAKDLDRLPAPTSAVSSNEVSRDNLRATIAVLADPRLGGRQAGSVENRRVARWIADRFASYGLPPAPGADHCIPFERKQIQDQNVVAFLHHEENSNAPTIIVGAHYDAQGQRGADVFPGADDNASGVAALLEIARISALRRNGPDMVFIAFGAEELGLLGAKAYVDAPSIPLSRSALMINLDMVGRPMLDGSPVRLLIPRADETIGYVIGSFDKPKTADILERAAEREDRPILGIPESVLTRLGFASDSVPFSPHMPTIFLSTGDHADYHRPTDTSEKLDFEQLARAARLSLAIIDEVAKDKSP